MTRADVLVAGIGNVFLGDDAFGVEVARRLSLRTMPPGVAIKDFGIRGFDLAFALDTANTIILVDAVGRGEAPGTLYTLELDVADADAAGGGTDAHSMNPMAVLQLAKQMGISPGRILLVGCEPESFGPENEGRMGLSPSVEGAVERAVELIDSMIVELRDEESAIVAGAGAYSKAST